MCDIFRWYLHDTKIRWCDCIIDSYIVMTTVAHSESPWFSSYVDVDAFSCAYLSSILPVPVFPATLFSSPLCDVTRYYSSAVFSCLVPRDCLLAIEFKEYSVCDYHYATGNSDYRENFHLHDDNFRESIEWNARSYHLFYLWLAASSTVV